MNPRTSLPLTLTFSAMAFVFACDGDGGDSNGGGDAVGAVQVIEADVPGRAVPPLLELAGIDEDARDVADFHIYTANPDGMRLEAPNCGLRSTGPVESTCGWCSCDAEFGIICVDYTCNGVETAIDGQVDYVDDRFVPVAYCSDAEGTQHVSGESWMDDCNVCTCKGDGSIVCTMMTCEPLPR